MLHRTVRKKSKNAAHNSSKTLMYNLAVVQDLEFDTWFNSIFNDEGIQALFKNSH